MIEGTLAILFLSPSGLGGYQDLVPHDTFSLLSPRFRRSEILGFVAGLGRTLCGRARLGRDGQASIKCQHESEDGGNHRCLSDPLGSTTVC
jgi:hypothetical protein